MDADRRSMLTTQRAHDRDVPASGNRYDRSNHDFVEEQKQRSQMLMREQDEHLDALGGQMERLGEMATSINVELEDQMECVALWCCGVLCCGVLCCACVTIASCACVRVFVWPGSWMIWTMK